MAGGGLFGIENQVLQWWACVDVDVPDSRFAGDEGFGAKRGAAMPEQAGPISGVVCLR